MVLGLYVPEISLTSDIWPKDELLFKTYACEQKEMSLNMLKLLQHLQKYCDYI
jgi:hypothetical protein